MIKEFSRSLIFWVYRALPKFNHAVVYGWPDYEDSALALQAGLDATPIRRVYFFIRGTARRRFQLQPKTTVIRKDSVKGWLCFLFARYVFFTHRCFMWRFPSNVVSVNVWHGMPIKTIGWMQKNSRGIASRYALATSDFWADIMQKSMRPFAGTLVTGLPRNDRLFSPPDSVWRRLGFANGHSFKKTIGWLPTYRTSVRGDILHDGVDSGNVFGMPGLTAEKLNDLLKQQNAFALVKPHPMAPFEEPKELSNLFIVDESWLRDRGLTLYEVLGQMDALVSDISSVVITYLILDRPVIHSFPDIAEYEASRGFSINPIADYFVGPVATTADQLLDCLVKIVQGEDSHTGQRRRIRALFHQNPDNNSTARLLRHLELLPKA